jgi:hypothetical protein
MNNIHRRATTTLLQAVLTEDVQRLDGALRENDGLGTYFYPRDATLPAMHAR